MTEWIPIGEQEPPGGSVVLATILESSGARDVWTLSVDFCGNVATGKSYLFRRADGWATLPNGWFRLVAWMYRPEPYAGDGTMRSEPQPTRQIRRGGG